MDAIAIERGPGTLTDTVVAFLELWQTQRSEPDPRLRLTGEEQSCSAGIAARIHAALAIETRSP